MMGVNYNPEDPDDMVAQPTASAELLAERVGAEIPLAIGKLFWALPILWAMLKMIQKLQEHIDDLKRDDQ